MPEIQAYQNHFEHRGFKACILVKPTQMEMEAFDLLWFFMGLQPALNKKNRRKIIVHEYCSGSTPPFPGLKDMLKKAINPRPDFRISLIPEHRGKVFPGDKVPLILRKQGVHSCFYQKIVCPKDHDFIYTGSALKMRNTHHWLQAFLQAFPGKTIVLVGNHEAAIRDQFRKNSNIQFRNPVPVTELPKLLAQARYAVNHVPDIYPFNIQPSTKLLEYCAAGCNVISNRYQWVEQFNRQKKAGLFFIKDDLSNLTPDCLERHQGTAPDMEDYRWESIFNLMELHKILQYNPVV